MPFTPFHFGPGLFAKSLFSRHFSWVAFVTSQIIIDFETLYYLLQRTYPVHRFFHTFLGATIAGCLTGVALVAATRLMEKVFPFSGNFIRGLRPSLRSELSTIGLIAGALVGGVSHPFLDGIMHRDARPFAPWSQANPFLRCIGLEALHMGCLLLGLVGLVALATRFYREGLAERSSQPAEPPPSSSSWKPR